MGAEVGGAVGGKLLGRIAETPIVKNLTSKVGNMLPKFLSTTKTAATPVSLVKKNTTMMQSVKNGTTSVLKNSAKESIKAPIQNYIFGNN